MTENACSHQNIDAQDPSPSPSKTFIPEGEAAPASQIGATLEALSGVIAARRSAGPESYTYRLLNDNPDAALKKLMEEAGEVALAAKDVEAWLTSSLAAALSFEIALGHAPDAEQVEVHLSDEYDEAIDHLRYEAADVVYHLLVVLERYGISLDEFAAELNNRMTDEERPAGAVRLYGEHVNRGK
jgi:phosphoribosyl-ATP pyrophosphohydrolase/phosphoribosyl-ATP pyrophosphohydrolase/phosphoribosyl-AMP cyclohydrolase